MRAVVERLDVIVLPTPPNPNSPERAMTDLDWVPAGFDLDIGSGAPAVGDAHDGRAPWRPGGAVGVADRAGGCR